jgi:hypothetical protein
LIAEEAKNADIVYRKHWRLQAGLAAMANASQTSPIVTMKRQLKQSAEAYHSVQIPPIGYTPQGRLL